MNARLLIAGLLALVAAGAAGWWVRSSHQAPEGAPAQATLPAQVGGPARLEQPVAPPAGAPVTDRTAQPAAPALPLEPVEPLLELNLVASSSVAAADANTPGASIDEMLEGKHAGKTKTQLQSYWRSVQAVLDAQAHPEQLPKDKVLSPEALQALTIEAAWLKEKVYN